MINIKMPVAGNIKGTARSLLYFLILLQMLVVATLMQGNYLFEKVTMLQIKKMAYVKKDCLKRLAEGCKQRND